MIMILIMMMMIMIIIRFIRVVCKALFYLPDPRRVRAKRDREVMLRRVVSRHE
jgi:hypothetical protein